MPLTNAEKQARYVERRKAERACLIRALEEIVHRLEDRDSWSFDGPPLTVDLLMIATSALGAYGSKSERGKAIHTHAIEGLGE